MGETDKVEETHWRCSHCGYTVQAPVPPTPCPSCRQACEFHNVTCYAPECGFKGIDPRLT